MSGRRPHRPSGTEMHPCPQAKHLTADEPTKAMNNRQDGRKIFWQADNVMSGVFFFRLEAELFASTTDPAQQ
jgi:hypothetical protein